MDASLLIWLLLPVAAASGWFAATRTARSVSRRRARSDLASEYFKGINYVLNEQPDKAIEVFIKVLEVDAETLETHLALGNLYRRRGEVDRAIRLHQTLAARSTASDEQRYEALLELAQDYLSAGLLDRAENLFRELVEADRHTVQALHQLIDIYEQEKDWDEAVVVARRLGQITGSPLDNAVAQYRCEQAEQAREQGRHAEALELVVAARQSFPDCARASIIEGDIHAALGAPAAALEAYARVEHQDPDYVPEVVERTLDAFEALDAPERARDYLERMHVGRGGMTALLALAERVREEKGAAQAAELVVTALSHRPTLRGFEWLLELYAADEAEPRANALNAQQWSILQRLTVALLKDRPVYKCGHCGFPAKLLHWRCPGCKHWNSVRPIHGVEGE